MADDGPGITWATIIPDASYDMVARLPSGLIFLASVLWTILSTALGADGARTALLAFANAPAVPAVLIIGIGLGLAYMFGILLSPVSQLPARVTRSWIWNKVVDEMTEAGTANEFAEKLTTLRAITRHERSLLLAANPVRRPILRKMRAEMALADNLMAASILGALFAVAYPWLSTGQLSISRPHLVLLGIALVLSLIASPSRARTYFEFLIGRTPK